MKKIAVFIITAVLISTGCLSAQTRAEKKKAKQLELQAAYETTKALIEAGKMKFSFEWATTQKGRRISLTGNGYSLAIDGNIGAADIPYFGVAQVASMDGNAGITFDGELTEYAVKHNDKKHKTIITFKVKSDKLEYFNFIITIQASGYTHISVNSSNRNPISYEGKLEKL